MKRALVVVLAALLAIMAVGPVVPVMAAPRAAPKVVLVVGPAGAATDNYRRLANEAAAEARKLTPNVVKVYSPDATWPAVKQALEGASIVVYLGHGNGWPSKYRDHLYPPTQNGLGLNPHAGAGGSHQYFGEERIASEIDLAPNAIVVLSHLCYASGNTEPGLPEGTLDQAQQRVDNYAAGFIKAGAAAVIAEGHMGPAYYVRAILEGRRSVERIWRDSPSANNNLLRFDSIRSPGYVAQMDPDNGTSGFYRSIVLREGLASSNVLASATSTPAAILPPPEPTLVGRGLEFATPGLATPPTAGTTTDLTFGVEASDPADLPADVQVSVRWDRLDGGDRTIVVPPVAPPVAPAAPAPSGSPGTVGPGRIAPTPAPTPRTAPPPPAPIELVTAEEPGSIVAPVAAKRVDTGISVPVKVPSTPGLYRLVGTIHGPDGVAYDAATQALMPALIVRVTGPLTAVYEAPKAAYATAGGTLDLPVGVTNLGAHPWGVAAVESRLGDAERSPAQRATIVARWVSISGGALDAPTPEATAVLPAGLAPGASASVLFALTAPDAPGEYLVLIDVLTPRTGSLAADGVPPGIVSVTVGPPAR
jgi:hypothetical protein